MATTEAKRDKSRDKKDKSDKSKSERKQEKRERKERKKEKKLQKEAQKTDSDNNKRQKDAEEVDQQESKKKPKIDRMEVEATRSQHEDKKDKAFREEKIKKRKHSGEEERSGEPEKKKTKLESTKSPKDIELTTKFREENNITLSGDVTDFVPVLSFSNTPFSEGIRDATKGFSKPTPIQAQCWPILMAGRDAIGIAETGSGKTFAYGLPGLEVVKAKGQSKKPVMLVIAPTRELAQQNHDVLAPAAKSVRAWCLCAYGGVPKGPQQAALQKGTQVLVGCPGRIIDLVEDGSCDLTQIEYLVLDEADRMLDMGFEPAIRQIVNFLPKKRQTVMFSATWPKQIQQLASEFLKNPIRVTIGHEDLSANTRVKQIVEVLDIDARQKRLLEILKEYNQTQKEKVIVFVLYKKEAADIERFLQNKGWKCIGIHGNKSAPQRAEALEAFKRGNPPMLIATDVAARGLDIPKVAYVINYSFPLTVEDYVHRIGRTGRAGATGISHTFFHKFDKTNSGELIGVLRKAGQDVPEALMAFGTHVKKKEPKLGKITDSAASTHITFDDSDDE